MLIPITALYVAILTFILLWLAAGVGIMRSKTKTSIGDGGHMSLLESIRKHGNATEYVPIALILLGVLELNGAGPVLLHSLGALLVVSRLAHPFGLTAETMSSPMRAVGVTGTMLMMVVAAGFAIWQFAQSL